MVDKLLCQKLEKYFSNFWHCFNSSLKNKPIAASKKCHKDTIKTIPIIRIMSLLIARRAMEDYPINSASSNYSFVATRKDRI